MKKLDIDELSMTAVLGSIVVALVALMAGAIGKAAWDASEKEAAYKAYTNCLNAMKAEPIDVKQLFCGKIKDQL